MWTDRVLCLHCVWPCSWRVTHPGKMGRHSLQGFSVMGEGLYVTVDLHGGKRYCGRVPVCSGPAELMSYNYPATPLESHRPEISMDTVWAQTPVKPVILYKRFLLHPGPRNSLGLR